MFGIEDKGLGADPWSLDWKSSNNAGLCKYVWVDCGSGEAILKQNRNHCMVKNELEAWGGGGSSQASIGISEAENQEINLVSCRLNLFPLFYAHHPFLAMCESRGPAALCPTRRHGRHLGPGYRNPWRNRRFCIPEISRLSKHARSWVSRD